MTMLVDRLRELDEAAGVVPVRPATLAQLPPERRSAYRDARRPWFVAAAAVPVLLVLVVAVIMGAVDLVMVVGLSAAPALAMCMVANRVARSTLGDGSGPTVNR